MNQVYRNTVPRYGYTLQEFGGINNLVRIGENEFSDMENMSSAQYPLLSVREKRQLIREEDEGAEVVGFICKEAVVKAIRKNGECKLYINENEVSDFYLSADDEMCPKNIVGMGAYIVVFPDKKYINLLDTTDRGSLENSYSMNGSQDYFFITPCTAEGDDFENCKIQDKAPSNPVNGNVWVDTSRSKTVYKIWDSNTAQWQAVSTTYIKLSHPGIGTGFKKWDAVTIKGLDTEILYELDYTEEDVPFPGVTVSERVRKQLETINVKGVILYEVAEDNSYIIVSGIIDKAVYAHVGLKNNSFRMTRTCPEMDFVIECNNRLWGCRYGIEEGKTVNEIYACRQGDFKNWYAYLGVATDSYAVSLGSDGAFTGAVTFGGYPIFFKEDCLHKIYGNIPANYQLLTTVCRGVEKGMEKSIVTEGNVLYYKSPVDFCAYDGSLPVGISQKIARCNYEQVTGGGLRGRIYWSVKEEDGRRSLLVYDAATGLWMREAGENIRCFRRDGHILNMLVCDENGRYQFKSVNRDYDTRMVINSQEYPQQEDTVRWFCESGDIGFSDTYQKYVKKITLRVRITSDAEFYVYLNCGGEGFKQIGNAVTKKGIHSVCIPIPPGRCDNFRYRLEGKGQVEVFSIYFEFDEGSDRS